MPELFLDDIKLFIINKNSADQRVLQEDVSCLFDWSRTWKTEFNEDKCKVMGIGRSKLGQTVITMERKSGDSVELEETRSESDLGVVVNNKLKWDDQVDKARLKAT